MAGLRLLEGVVILDLTQYIASAFAARIVADFGAESLKVERFAHGDLRAHHHADAPPAAGL